MTPTYKRPYQAPKPVMPLMKPQVEFIESEALKGNSFFKSLFDQWTKKRGLSARQIACIDRAMIKEGIKEPVFSFNKGEVITISSKMARAKAEELKLDAFFRNVEITQVHAESAKAIQVSVKFRSDIVTGCHMCGRDLTCDVSRATAIGPVCAEKIGFKRPTAADAPKMLEAIDKMAKRVGEIKEIWLPKYSITRV